MKMHIREDKQIRGKEELIWKIVEILGIVVVAAGIIMGGYAIQMEIATGAQAYQTLITAFSTLIATGTILFALGDKKRRTSVL